MITLFRSNNIYALDQLKRAVANQLRSLAKRIELIGEHNKILRCEFLIENIDILTWLHNQRCDQKIYWSNRDESNEVGGIGIADLIECDGEANKKVVFDVMEDRLSMDNPHLRYYGGFCFTDASQSEEWKGYGLGRFTVPQFEIVHVENENIFAVNISVGDISESYIENIIQFLEKIDLKTDTTYRTPPEIEQRLDIPNKDQWIDNLESVIDDLKHNQYTKVVLARKSDFTFDKYIDPIALVKHLKDKTPNCFHFCIQINQKSGFLGASPERLFKRSGNNICTEAVAGTAARGNSQEEDSVLEKALLNSSKEIFEHNCVVENINDGLSKMCLKPIKKEALKMLKLKGSQHLFTQFEGELIPGTLDSDILNELHPTPAVGGTPTKRALEEIRKRESFDRGWYAGPIGYVGAEACEFAVGIRSGLIRENKLSLYTGAGIVKDSIAQREWEEIENKISRFIKVFDVRVKVA